MKDYNVYVDGVAVTKLNHILVEKQNLNDEQVEALKLSHELKYRLLNIAKENIKDPYKLKMLSGIVDALESEQQKLWNFEVDPNYHQWFNFPGCSCPKMDNKERIGTLHRIISEDCPIHK